MCRTIFIVRRLLYYVRRGEGGVKTWRVDLGTIWVHKYAPNFGTFCQPMLDCLFYRTTQQYNSSIYA